MNFPDKKYKSVYKLYKMDKMTCIMKHKKTSIAYLDLGNLSRKGKHGGEEAKRADQ
jgi:hypothetical protein